MQQDRRCGYDDWSLPIDLSLRRRQSILRRLGTEFSEYEIVGVEDAQAAANLLSSMAKEEGLQVPVVAVAREHVAIGAVTFSFTEADWPGAKLVVYGDPSEGNSPALPVSCVATEDIEASVYAALLERDLRRLCIASPIAAEVLDAISVDLRVLNPNLEVLWENAGATSNVPAGMASEKTCWKRCHGFCHRECACPNCEIEEGLRGTSSSGCHLLPIRGRIESVEKSGSPLRSRDGQRVLAMVETSRLVTGQWEEAKPAHQRLSDGRHVKRVAEVVSDGIDRPEGVELRRVEQQVRGSHVHVFMAFNGLLHVGIVLIEQVDRVMGGRDVGLRQLGAVASDNPGEQRRGTHYASPLIADEKIFTIADDGHISVLTLGAEPQILAVNDMEDAVYATPAIVDGTIYVRTHSALFAFRDE